MNKHERYNRSPKGRARYTRYDRSLKGILRKVKQNAEKRKGVS